MKRAYRSRVTDVVSMKSTASAALISAEKIAARPRLPMAGGTPCRSSVGRARSGDGQIGEPQAGDHAQAHRHDRVEEEAERVQSHADPDGRSVARAVDLLQQSGRHHEGRASMAR